MPIHPLFQSILQAHGAPEPRKPKIVTEFIHPPIPDRRCDWIAYDDNTYDGPGSAIGSGATKAAAIADLRDKLDYTCPMCGALPGHECSVNCPERDE